MEDARSYMSRTTLSGFVLFGLFTFMQLPDSPEVAVSVVPGLHTPVLPPWTVLSLIVLTVLLTSMLTYLWLLIKKTGVRSGYLLAHTALSLPAIIVCCKPSKTERLSVDFNCSPSLVLFIIGLAIISLLGGYAVLLSHLSIRKNRSPAIR